ncbi:rab9 effector protein with kelch motifs isoform X1 [Harpia harpyja]|uniref:rab9 effector protein with kelch motifs isoform X1 n=1 Tax=Harpia harpyja TaxID=202280 RepID=UPI0022B1C25C|nr:rab9 effector protein with kelch motifs isoform X1 [Harpia harpyja]
MGPRALPLLEPGRRPQPAKWYRLSPRGDRPRGRVGHGCLFLPGGGTGRVLLLGGADPAGAFADAHFVELGAHRWVAAGWSGLRPRYEHATFLPATDPPRLWVFGGAHPAGNRSCVQALDLGTGTWESPEVSGVQPLPRTFHTSSAAVGDCLYVFGGGDKGAEPVKDQRLHVFDTATLTWSQPDTHGDPPSPRHGHAVVAVGTKLFIHGGLAGDIFYNDLFCIDTHDMRWVKIPATGDVPGGRASHSSAVFKDHLYIFGGIGPDGTLDTTYKYHTEKQQWTLLQFDSPLPAGRLDHAMCVIPWQAGKSRDAGAVTRDNKAGKESTASVGDKAGPLQKSQEEEGCAEDTVMHLLLIFGGMDTQGEIYRDCIVSLIE